MDIFSHPSYIFGYNEGIVHQLVPVRLAADVVEGVRCLESFVHRVMHDGRGEGVEGHKVCDFTVSFYNVSVDNTRPWQEPMAELLLREAGRQRKLGQILKLND